MAKPSEQKPVTAGDLHAEGAMTALLKDALKPNLVQTLEHVRQSYTAARLQILHTDVTRDSNEDGYEAG